MKRKVDLLIVGCGPAGMTAAIYAKRSGLDVLILEEGPPGGKLLNTHRIDNYPGVPKISGFNLAQKFLEQVNDLKIEIVNSRVDNIKNKDKNSFISMIGNGEQIESKKILITAGMKSKKLNVKNYDEFFGKGISLCVVCDGPFYKGENIVIVGGGNSAIEESIYASTFAKKIFIINKFDKLSAEKISIEKLKKIDNVEIINNDEVESISGKEQLEKIYLKSGKEIDSRALFVYVGYNPNIDFISYKLNFDKDGFIISNENMETNIKGLFVAGDIRSKKFRQITTANSDATIAALKIVEDILHER